MPYATQTKLGPEFTPPTIRNLIIATMAASIACILIEPFFNHLFGMIGPMGLFTLSLQGIKNYYLWQLITYFFVYDSAGLRVNFFWLLGLAFNMYILWVMGSHILERVGSKPFLRLYFLSGLLAGLAALLFMRVTNTTEAIGGPTAPILAILTCWAVLNAESEILLFFLFPIKARWLVAAILGVLLLISFGNEDPVHFFFYLSGAATGYFYSVIIWGYRSPYPITHRFDRALRNLVEPVRRYTEKQKRPSAKIFDIKTGKSLDEDERFMDAMLDKISKHGKNSLTWREKRRMDKIAKKSKKF